MGPDRFEQKKRLNILTLDFFYSKENEIVKVSQCLPYFYIVHFRFHLLAPGAAFVALNSASSGRHQ